MLRNSAQVPSSLGVAAHMARVGACAEVFLTEAGHPCDVWADLDVQPGKSHGEFILLARHGEESASEVIDALGGAGSRTHHPIGPVHLAMHPLLIRSDPWAPQPGSAPLPLAWIAAVAASAARTVLDGLAATRRVQPQHLPLVWLARSAGAILDRGARFCDAPRTTPQSRRANVRALR